MKVNTKRRKNARRGFEHIIGRQALVDRMSQMIKQCKQGQDTFLFELGRMMNETVMHTGREEIVGPDYYPTVFRKSFIQKMTPTSFALGFANRYIDMP